MTELIGVIAACGTTVAFVPQVIRTVKTNDTSGISFYMYLILIFGMLMWVAYGVLINSPSVVVANIVTSLLAAIVLFIKARNLLAEKKQAKN